MDNPRLDRLCKKQVGQQCYIKALGVNGLIVEIQNLLGIDYSISAKDRKLVEQGRRVELLKPQVRVRYVNNRDRVVKDWFSDEDVVVLNLTQPCTHDWSVNQHGACTPDSYCLVCGRTVVAHTFQDFK